MNWNLNLEPSCSCYEAAVLTTAPNLAGEVNETRVALRYSTWVSVL